MLESNRKLYEDEMDLIKKERDD